MTEKTANTGATAEDSAAAVSANLERERLVSLINSMADGVIALDEHAKIVTTNGAALNILDSNESLDGKRLHQVMKLVDKNNQSIDLHHLVDDLTRPLSSRDWRIEYDDSSYASLYVSIAPVRLGYGKKGMRGHVVLLRDISQEKSLEEERDEFISVVSHELRTPIAIAEGNVSNAVFLFGKSGIQNPVVEKSLAAALEQITFLSGMMNDLATLSRAERNKLTLDISSINVRDLIHELIDAYDDDAHKKGLLLTTDIDPHLELLSSSKLYVKEVLQNFSTNAVKYTESGRVTIGAKQRDDGVEFYVEDTGIGISKSDKERIFDKFFRSEDYRTRENSGTGLGLYVTMKLARLLHAEIEVHSELNKGSRFTIFVPNLEPSDSA
jgi:two-component system, OmpR family, phosphate regulon sensor histidine kinase PhoR